VSAAAAEDVRRCSKCGIGECPYKHAWCRACLLAVQHTPRYRAKANASARHRRHEQNIKRRMQRDGLTRAELLALGCCGLKCSRAPFHTGACEGTPAKRGPRRAELAE
jgi:hypothetical protein